MPRNDPASAAAAGAMPTLIGKRFINELTPPTKGSPRRTVWDSKLKGFGLRVYPTGQVVYVLQYRMKAPGAPTRTYTIGKQGSPWSPDTARERARDLLEQVRRGTDPAAELKSETSAAAEDARQSADADEAARRYDFDAFADRFIERHVKANGLRSLADIESTFARDLRPWFRGRSVNEIRPQDVKDMRSHVGLRSKSAANKAHKWLNAAFIWGVEHDRLETSPMVALKRPFDEPKRTRWLQDWEIALIWSVLPSLTWQFAMLFRILLITGQRLREVAGMRWEEIEPSADRWLIPGARTKNKREHLVPISAQFRAILDAIEPDPERRHGLVLTTTGTTPVSGFSKMKAQIDALVAEALLTSAFRHRGDVAPWVVHDARRTLSTNCGDMRIPINHAEAVLNHVSGMTGGGVAGVYWLYDFEREKRAALRRWGARVETFLKRHKVDFLPTPASEASPAIAVAENIEARTSRRRR